VMTSTAHTVHSPGTNSSQDRTTSITWPCSMRSCRRRVVTGHDTMRGIRAKIGVQANT
jgi:hypothetical protein